MTKVSVIAKRVQIAFLDPPEREDMISMDPDDDDNYYDGYYAQLTKYEYFESIYQKYYENIAKISVYYKLADDADDDTPVSSLHIPSERWIKKDDCLHVWLDVPIVIPKDFKQLLIESETDFLRIRNTTTCICQHIKDVFMYPKWINVD